MSQPLFPVVEVPDFISEDSQYDTQYKRSMKWNTELGDFVRDGAHRIKECDGKEAFAKKREGIKGAISLTKGSKIEAKRSLGSFSSLDGMLANGG